jgi:hypothetical protein
MSIEELRKLFAQMPPPGPGANILKKHYTVDLGPLIDSNGRVLRGAKTAVFELTCEWDNNKKQWVEIDDKQII